ncbi:MAG: cell division protein FtsZ [Bacteroidota bacterium]
MVDMLKFDLPKNQSSIIKVIGVGGGGSNAVNHMYHQGIKGVDFIICNTDEQAMIMSPVPTKIQLGVNLTGGLGAGAAPTVGRNAALENSDDIRAVLEKGTKMLFITAGLGGGTGTGAAPVIAQISRELGILTVGIVTIPFSFEGRKRRQSAEDGIRQLKQNVDALLIISNDKLRQLCGDLPLSEAFTRADNVLTTAAKGIAEIITVVGYINVDFEDVKTVMKDSGVAIMGTGIANGPNRAQMAVEEALNSPLLDNNDITGAGNLLLYISSGKNEITMDEVTEITDYIQEKTKSTGDVIWGNGFDETLDDKISVTIIATGFDEDHKQKDPSKPVDVTVHNLYSDSPRPQVEQRVIFPHTEPAEHIDQTITKHIFTPSPEPVAYEIVPATESAEPMRIIEFSVEKPEPDSQTESTQTLIEDLQPVENLEEPVFEMHFKPVPATPPQQPSESEPYDFQTKKADDRIYKLRHLSEKLKSHQPIENNLYEIENVPAYKRRNVELNDVTPSSESQRSKYNLTDNADSPLESTGGNTYLNQIVD